MTRRLLDLFCGAGGCAMGYHRAGFEVVGVDVVNQPHYPFEFHRADAMTYPLDGFDVIHASPPCPLYSVATPKATRSRHPDFIGPLREILAAQGLPFVIENVMGAPVRSGALDLFGHHGGTMLCGSMFGLRVRRHRLFESNAPMPQLACRHREQPDVLTVTGTGYGGKQPGRNGTKPAGIDEAREVMGVTWPMTIRELSNSIPPAYTEFIGAQLMTHLDAQAAA